MKATKWTISALLTLLAGTAAAETGLPYLVRSTGTDRADLTNVLFPAPSRAALPARLLPSPGGRTVASFRRASETPGRYVYLGFGFAGGPFAVRVVTEQPVAGAKVYASGVELASVPGSPDTFASTQPLPGEPSDLARRHVLIRLERQEALEVPVAVELLGFTRCEGGLVPACGTPTAQPPIGLRYLFNDATQATEPDALIPAVIRTQGFHGPIRTDVVIVNRASAPLVLYLNFIEKGWGRSDSFEREVPANSRTRIPDVVRSLFGEKEGIEGRSRSAASRRRAPPTSSPRHTTTSTSGAGSARPCRSSAAAATV